MMVIDIPTGKFVLAVSGGVDSMVLLDLLAKQANSSQLRAKSSTSSIELVVAHFNHGIRPDSSQDEELVKAVANKYGLPIEIGHGELGPGASEETARLARYAFLEAVKRKHKAAGIITAHHQDDLIETAFINLIRGTGRQGLSSIFSRKIKRPLLNVPKKTIVSYAQRHNLDWREDPSNIKPDYLRNYVRLKLIPALGAKKKAEMVSNLNKIAKINKIIDKEIATLSHNKEIDRKNFALLPLNVSKELLTYWLRQNNLRDFDRRTVSRVAQAIKTAQPSTRHEVVRGKYIILTKEKATLS